MTIGESIRNCRNNKGLSQIELADSIRCKSCQISQWETGRMFPSILSCITLADALEVSLDELVGRDVNKIKHIERITENENQG